MWVLKFHTPLALFFSLTRTIPDPPFPPALPSAPLLSAPQSYGVQGIKVIFAPPPPPPPVLQNAFEPYAKLAIGTGAQGNP